MYEGLKHLIKNILPDDLLVRFEPQIRSTIFLFYRGSKQGCNICGKKFRKYILLENNEKLCPSCGSLPRSRRLWSLLEPELKKGQRVLHFSPSRNLDKKLGEQAGLKYTTSDYVGEFKADKQLDITRIAEPDSCYDLIICYHILEHVEDDRNAMLELHRILGKEGKCYIQTPFKSGETYEDFSITTEQERKAHFGQEDHVRVYAVQGLKERLKEAGFAVKVLSFSEAPDNYLGLKEEEHVIIASKA